MRKTELLAPAGSMESLKAAVNAGADAVYIGGTKFGARLLLEVWMNVSYLTVYILFFT